MASTVQNPLLTIEQEYGQSIWMDNLSRDILNSGELADLIKTRGVLGITSNPAIFEKAIAGNAMYDAQIVEGVKAGKSLNDIYRYSSCLRHLATRLR
jgi:transaldolase